MTYSTNAKNFYEQYVVNLGALVMQVTCLRESETYEAIEELRDGGIIAVEVGQVVDAAGNKVSDCFGVTKLKNLT